MTRKIYQSDVIIIGGGVVGAAILHKFVEYDLRVVLLEKAADLAAGTSKANSGIFHAPYNINPHTLKGKLHLKAMQLGPDLLHNLHVPFRQLGALVVAYTPEEVSILQGLLAKVEQLGIDDIELISEAVLRELEPNINLQASAALLARRAGVISPYEYTFALAENAVLNGGSVFLETEVTEIRKADDFQEVLTTGALFRGKIVINAAGLAADQIAAMVLEEEFTINPRRGEYYLYDHCSGDLVQHVLFPVPTETSKGILVTPTIDGNLLVGPNSSENIEKTDTKTTTEGLAEVFSAGRRVLPGLTKSHVINQFAGVRAVIKETEDFYIQPSKKRLGLVHVAGIQSPGLTLAPAIADYVLEIVADLGILELRPRKDFAFLRQPVIRFSQLSREQQADLIAEDPRYGQIICRCEQVTEKEIIDALTGPLPVKTVGGVKRRTRSGMGRCQGGFCSPQIVSLLAEYRGISPLEVTKEGGKSFILRNYTKTD